MVGDHNVRFRRPARRQVERLAAIREGRRAITLRLEQKLEHLPHHGIILDDHDRARRDGVGLAALSVIWGPYSGLVGRERRLDGEDRTLAKSGTHVDRVAKHISDALHDGKTEAQAKTTLAG